jgi:hypothetical protein
LTLTELQTAHPNPWAVDRTSVGMPIPMLADFALRLAGGLAGLLLLTPRRIVPPAFFRTQCQIVLALFVLAALDLGRTTPDSALVVLTITAAVLSFVGSIAFGLGLPRLGLPITITTVALSVALLVLASLPAPPVLAMLNAAGRLASAAVLGSSLTAMLLGHHYLTAPAMSIDPLRRFVRSTGWSLAARAVLGATGLGVWLVGTGSSKQVTTSFLLFLAMRWVVGIGGPALAVVMAWRTVEIRSTQSATGILYICVTLLLFGELTALTLSRNLGIIL